MGGRRIWEGTGEGPGPREGGGLPPSRQPSVPPAGMGLCKEEPPHPSPPPYTFWPVFWGCRRRGTESYCTVYRRETAREGRGPRLTPRPSSRPLLVALRLSLPMCFQGVPTSNPAPSLRTPDTLPSPEARPAAHLGGACCVCRGAGGQPGALPQVPLAAGRAQPQRPFPDLCLASPLKRKPTHQADFGVSVYC